MEQSSQLMLVKATQRQQHRAELGVGAVICFFDAASLAFPEAAWASCIVFVAS